MFIRRISPFLFKFLLLIGMSVRAFAAENGVCSTFWEAGYRQGSLFTVHSNLGYSSYSDACTAYFDWLTPMDRRREYSDGSYEVDTIISGTVEMGSQETLCRISYTNYRSWSPCTEFCTASWTASIGTCREPPSTPIILSGPEEVLPTGTPGGAPVTITARVASAGQPIARVAVSFSVVVTPNSGGHEHHDPTRPNGTLTSTTQGGTDANGEVKLTFTPPEVAGTYTIKATCAICSSGTGTKVIKVKVPDLVPISPNSPRNADGSFVYALTSVDALHAGEGRYHKNQYYLTEQAQQNLLGLITSFAAAGWGTVALNDASLYWGGRYDIKGNWGGSHLGHRDGREIDISFTRAGNPIPKQKQNDFYDRYCKNKATEVAFSILHHYLSLPHFHVYLEKQKTCNRTEK